MSDALRKEMSVADLTSVVRAFRAAVHRRAPFPRTFAALNGFPRGCCKDASFLFARVLDLRHGKSDTTYVWGQRGPALEWVTHGWLESNGLIIDLTLDQFTDATGLPFVLPKEGTEFHRTWELQSAPSHYPAFWSFHEEARADYEATLEVLLDEIAAP